MALQPTEQEQTDATNAQMEDILNPPVEVAPAATELERPTERSEEISGIVSPSNMVADDYQAPPVRFKQALTQSLTPSVIAENPGIEKSYYDRFIKHDDTVREAKYRDAISKSIGFLIPTNAQEAIEAQGRLPITVQRAQADGTIKPGNFQFVRFDENATPEQRGALMASQGGYYFAQALVDNADPMAIDSVRTQENPEGQYGYIAPRYIEDIRKAKSPAVGYTPLTSTLLAKETPTEGYETLIPILNKLSSNPADHAALIAAEDAGEMKIARAFQGVRDTVGFVLDLAGFVAKPFTESATYEAGLESGLFLYGEPQYEIAKANSQTLKTDAKIQEDMRKKGMLIFDEKTQTYTMSPEYIFDYAKALEAEGFSPEAAESYWMYARDAEDRAYRFLGEEVPLAVASAGFRYGLAMVQVKRFNTWIDNNYGSADEAFKAGKTGGELAAEYLETYPDRAFSNWARGMSASSMRINLSVYKDTPNFSAANQIRVQSEQMAQATSRMDDLIIKRNATENPREIRTLQAQIDAERKAIDGFAKRIENAQGQVLKGTWLGDTFRTTGYGILGASVAGQVVSDHFAGGEGSQAIAEVLGFMSGHTAMQITIGGTKKLVNVAGMTGDVLINTAMMPFTTMDPNILRRAGLYDELSFSLNKTERQVLNSISNLSPEARQSVIQSATYVRNLQDKLSGIINPRTQQPYFTDDFVQQTLGVVTGLNVLLLAEKQLARGVDVTDITDMGSAFYAKEAILSRKAELANRMNQAVAQLLGAAQSSTDADVRELAEGLASYNDELRRGITRDLAEVETVLDERFGMVESALSGNQDAIRMVDPTWKPGDDLPDMSEFLIRDDEKYRKVLESVGMPSSEISDRLNERMNERLVRIKEAANVYARDYGRTPQGGADNVGTYQYYITRSRNYNAATQPYEVLYSQYGDNTLMDVTSFYDEVNVDPTLVESFNVPAASAGAQREAGLTAKPAHFRNWSVQFNDAADRTMAQLDAGIERAAAANNLDAEDLKGMLYEAVGLNAKSNGIDKWERIRGALRGDTDIPGVTEESVRRVRALVIGGRVPKKPGEAGAVATQADLAMDDDALAQAAIQLANNIPLAITLQEFHMFKRGLNASIRKTYSRETTGAGALQERGMVDRLDELAESGDGFYDNFFNAADRQPSNASTDLAAANRTFQVEFAQRHMRPGTPGEKIGKGVSPKEATPSLIRAGATGRIKPDEFFINMLGDLSVADPITKGFASTDTVLRVNNEIAQVAGKHFEEPITVYTGGRGQRTEVVGDRGGHYQMVEGDEATEAFRGALKLKVLEVIRNSPAAAPLRKALSEGAMFPAQREKALRDIAEQMQKGESLFAEEGMNMNFLFSVSELKMLRANDAGSYTQVPLLDMDSIFKEVSIDTMFRADDEIRGLVTANIAEHKNTVAKMKEEFRARATKESYERDKLSKALESIDADPQAFFFKQFNAGDVGFTEVESIEQLVKARITKEVNADIEAGNMSREMGQQKIDDAVNAYKGLRKEYFSTWIRSQSERPIEGLSAVGVNFDNGERLMTVKRGFDGGALLESIGAGTDAMAQKRREIFSKMTDNDEELFETLRSIGEWSVLHKGKMTEGMSVDGVPTGLSIESWISRIYSINRGVVSPRYVGAEAMIQSIRMQGLSLVEAMVNDVKLAKKVQDILISGKPLKTEQENFEFFQALSVAAGMVAVRADRANTAEEKSAKDDEPVEAVLPSQVNQQMEFLMP